MFGALLWKPEVLIWAMYFDSYLLLFTKESVD